jgi:predicted transcriptional regulator
MKAKEVMSKNYAKADMNDSVSKVLGQLKLTKEWAALLFDGRKYKGIFSKHRMIRSKMDPAAWKAKHMLKQVPVLNGNEDLKETARLMITGNCHLLPVAEKGKVLGIVKAVDIIDQLDANAKKKKIMDIATTGLVVVNEDDRTGKATQLMGDYVVDRLPIVDDAGNLLNIVSLTDLMEKCYLKMQSKTEARGRGGLTQAGPRTIRAYRSKRPDLTGFPVRNFATPVMITATENENIGDIIAYMRKYRIGSIVITRGKKAVGIITVRDLLKLFLPDMLTF